MAKKRQLGWRGESVVASGQVVAANSSAAGARAGIWKIYIFGFWFYNHVAPQQPVKGVLLVGASPTRRIRRITTERLGACLFARKEGRANPE
jgi:hypothetical protein